MNILVPGEPISDDMGLLRGHGTYLEGSMFHSSLAGTLQRVDKLITVSAHKQRLETCNQYVTILVTLIFCAYCGYIRYSGEVGDLIVGRISGIDAKRWKVDILSHKVLLFQNFSNIYAHSSLIDF